MKKKTIKSPLINKRKKKTLKEEIENLKKFIYEFKIEFEEVFDKLDKLGCYVARVNSENSKLSKTLSDDYLKFNDRLSNVEIKSNLQKFTPDEKDNYIMICSEKLSSYNMIELENYRLKELVTELQKKLDNSCANNEEK